MNKIVYNDLLRAIVSHVKIQQLTSRSHTQWCNRCVIECVDCHGEDPMVVGNILVPLASATVAEIALARIL